MDRYDLCIHLDSQKELMERLRAHDWFYILHYPGPKYREGLKKDIELEREMVAAGREKYQLYLWYYYQIWSVEEQWPFSLPDNITVI